MRTSLGMNQCMTRRTVSCGGIKGNGSILCEQWRPPEELNGMNWLGALNRRNACNRINSLLAHIK